MALCMTTENSRQRMWRSCLSLIWAISRPRNETLPRRDAGGRAEQARDGEDQRRLAAAGLAHDGEELARGEVEVDIVDGDDRSRRRSRRPPRDCGPRAAGSTAIVGAVRASRVPATTGGSGRRRTVSARLRRASARPGRARRRAARQAAHGPQGRVGDLVEGEVEQGERPSEQRDADARHERPQDLPGLEGRLLLGPVEHRAPALSVRVAEPDELQAGRGQHGEDGVEAEGRHDERAHRRQHLGRDDVAGRARPGRRLP